MNRSDHNGGDGRPQWPPKLWLLLQWLHYTPLRWKTTQRERRQRQYEQRIGGELLVMAMLWQLWRWNGIWSWKEGVREMERELEIGGKFCAILYSICNVHVLLSNHVRDELWKRKDYTIYEQIDYGQYTMLIESILIKIMWTHCIIRMINNLHNLGLHKKINDEQWKESTIEQHSIQLGVIGSQSDPVPPMNREPDQFPVSGTRDRTKLFWNWGPDRTGPMELVHQKKTSRIKSTDGQKC